MKYSNKFFFAFFAALVLLFPSGAVFAAPKEEPKPDERVTVIVEVEGDAVLTAKNASKLGAKEFLKTSEAEKLEKKARAVQSSVLSEAEVSLGEELNVNFTYTHVLNGFSMDIDADKVASLYALPNVKNVYVLKDESYTASPEEQKVEAELFESETTDEEAPENSEEKPYIIKGSEYMEMQYMHDIGYTGKGMVIAVIDSNVDVTHEMFQAPVANPRLSKQDIADILDRETLSVSTPGAGQLSVSRVYRNEKFPYVFNYHSFNSDSLEFNSDHGIHVAGIAAGSSGIDFQGKKFVGVAPDAQIIFMATACDENHGLDTPAIIAALEDASKLGADVINCSLNSSSSLSEEPRIKAVNAARSAGIMVALAAGNIGRGDNIFDVSAKQIDYNGMKSMDDISSGTAVANADGKYIIFTYKQFTVAEKEIYYYSVFSETDFNEIFGTDDLEYVYVNEARESDFENLNVEGKFVFVNQYGISFNEKVTNAYNAGAAGIFIIFREAPDVSTEINPAWRFFPIGVMGGDMEDAILEAEEKKLRFNETIQRWQKNGALSMNAHSSWGAKGDLELKPEISAAGENIYSASLDNGYVLHSGTSMATPFYAGASALMFEYMAANPSKYAPFGNRATLAENLLMSTADIIMEDVQNGIPYSPRKQGAGMLNLKRAAKTPVFLLGDEFETNGYVYRKAKISLREIILDNENSFKFSFTAQNMTDIDVTYDKLGMYVTTDSADENGMIKGARPLHFASDLPDSFTVPANSSVDLTVKVTLDKDELEENLDVFVNGFFIDGFVTLENTSDQENIPGLSIPFTGFYGDWYNIPIFDEYYYDDPYKPLTYMYTYTNVVFPGQEEMVRGFIMGRNLFDEDNKSLEGREYVGFSPNFDGEADNVQGVALALRLFGLTDYAVCDTDGNDIIRKSDVDSVTGIPYYASKYTQTYLTFENSELTALPDGDYIFRVYAGFYYKEPYEQTDVLEMPFYIDRVAPEIKEFSVNGDTLTLSLSDNRYVMGYILSGTSDGEPKTEAFALEPAKLCETTADISEYDKGSIKVEVYDYALNRTTAGELPPSVTLQERYGKEFTFGIENVKDEEISCTFTMVAYLNGRPVKLTSGGGVIPRGNSTKIINFDPGVYDKIKLFIWDSLEGMKPVCEQVEIG